MNISDELEQARQENARLEKELETLRWEKDVWREKNALMGKAYQHVADGSLKAQRELDAARKVVAAGIKLVREANTCREGYIPTNAAEIIKLEDAIIAMDAEQALAALAASPAAGEVQPVEVGRGEVERLREALEPFARLASMFPDRAWRDEKAASKTKLFNYGGAILTPRDFRAAAAALTSTPAEGGEA